MQRFVCFINFESNQKFVSTLKDKEDILKTFETIMKNSILLPKN